ncbi:hypothetical protein MATL_G00084770 [Megalops atlanticus]|uniref:Uncharacterized protein n=1 Tax=Megalops atlanticus TaxID=7932 RepID=A0A9D3TDV5_MEGAT|nr:hypothetical protein MATL_G00084770 [Megalops atlanticus]
MKLRNVRTEDRGEFMCKVHTISESVNATAWIAELGFSSLHIFVVVLSISAASIAILMVFLVLCCKTKKDESKKALWLYCLQVIVPCSMISIAFVLWGHIEGFFAEAYVCSIASLMRILILFEVAPYLKSSSEKPHKMLKYRVVPIEFSFILIGLNSDLLSIFLTDHNPDTEGKFGTGLLFGLILVLCVVAVFVSGSKRWTRCICLAAGIGFECLFLLATDNFGLFSLENSAWICVTVFLCILIVTSLFPDLPGITR